MIPLAPLHNPANLQGYKACLELLGPKVPQVAVFDTAFHSTMPPMAYMYALPYEYFENTEFAVTASTAHRINISAKDVRTAWVCRLKSLK